jgi:DNA-binding response OmpR family regulator
MRESQATLLVVDDEEYIRHLLQRILEEAGYRVITASNGNEAMVEILSNEISLVLLDIIMPGMDGFQTLEHIRQKSAVPVLMVTGMGSLKMLQTSLALGADDYIKKPFRSAELLARIKAKLRRDEGFRVRSQE